MAATTLPPPVKQRKRRTQPRQAPRYRVLFHNDEITTMEFVIGVLRRFFNHDLVTATKIMLEVHYKGVGLAGTYPLEIAELKQQQTISAARPDFPLTVTIEPED